MSKKKELGIDDIVFVRPPGKDMHYYIPKPIDRQYYSLDMALQTIRMYYADDEFRRRVDAGNRKTFKRKKKDE